MSNARLTQLAEKSFDKESEVFAFEDVAHKKSHEGKRWYVIYSVADLGAMTTPNDTITLSWKTPLKEKGEMHLEFSAKGTAGWRIRLIEAPTGGVASPTGTLNILNHKTSITEKSEVLDATGVTKGVVSYDATLATGGITLWDEYLEGSAGPLGNAASGGGRNELELTPDTVYQLSLFGTDNNPGTVIIDWYMGDEE